jgi:hypothetical protein
MSDQRNLRMPVAAFKVVGNTVAPGRQLSCLVFLACGTVEEIFMLTQQPSRSLYECGNTLDEGASAVMFTDHA